jgi:hypothetical protein
VKLPFDAALRQARDHEVRGRLNHAIELYQAIADEADFEPAYAAVGALVSLLMRTMCFTEAQQALASFLQRQFILPTAGDGSKPRILLVFGLASWDSIIFPRFDQAFPFEINAGHFDIAALLKTDRLAGDPAFVPESIGPGAIPRMRERIRAYRAVVNVVADPVAEAKPLANTEELLAEYPGKVINRPACVAATARDAVAKLLADVPGFVVPRATRIESLDRPRLEEAFAESPGGLIVRPINSQTGAGVRLLRTPEDLSAALSEYQGQAVFLTPFHDFRDPAGHFVKMRFFKVGSELFPEHRIAADVWNIHGADRQRLMRDSEDLKRAEHRFMEDPEAVLGADGMRALAAALDRFQLDYVGIDFAQLADGRLLLFEANPAMRLYREHGPKFGYLTPYLDRISQAFTRMIEETALGGE